MNTMIEKQDLGIIRPSQLQDWLTSHGIITVTTEECAHLLGVPIRDVSQRLVRLRSKGELVSGARGLWIAVPSEFREMGAPEPMRYIHNLMGFYDNEYCVGYNRSYASLISKKRITLASGSAYVSSIGTTMLMVAANPENCGGIDNAATVICELADNQTDFISEVLTDANFFPRAAVNRLGWILDYCAEVPCLEDMEKYCTLSSEPTMLSPGGCRMGKVNKRWNVIENRRIETDV